MRFFCALGITCLPLAYATCLWVLGLTFFVPAIFSIGCLGWDDDEGCSKMWEACWIAEFRESIGTWMCIVLSGYSWRLACFSVYCSATIKVKLVLARVALMCVVACQNCLSCFWHAQCMASPCQRQVAESLWDLFLVATVGWGLYIDMRVVNLVFWNMNLGQQARWI